MRMHPKNVHNQTFLTGFCWQKYPYIRKEQDFIFNTLKITVKHASQQRKKILYMYIQVKCEVIEENLTGCERREMSNGFRFEVLHVHSGNVGGPKPLRSLKSFIDEK